MPKLSGLCVLLFLLLSGNLAIGQHARNKVSPPSPESLRDALAAIQEDPLRESDPAGFAKKLRRKISDYAPGTGHYALLMCLADANESLGQAQDCLSTLDQIERHYDVAPIELYMPVFRRLLKQKKDRAGKVEIAARCLALFDTSLASEDFAHARTLASIGRAAARKAKVGWLKRATKKCEELHGHFARLHDSPTTKALRAVADFHLHRRDWNAARPILSRLGPDLEAACNADADKPSESGDCLALSAKWRRIASHEHASMFRQRLLDRAAHWLEAARHASRDDAQRLDLERRIEQFLADREPERKPTLLASLRETDSVVGYAELEKGDELDGKVEFDGKPIRAGLFTHPADDAALTHVGYAFGDKYGSLHGSVALADSGAPFGSELEFEIAGDGRTLWTSPRIDRTHIGSAVDFHVDVSGMHRIELRVRCMGSSRSAHAVWIAPRARK